MCDTLCLLGDGVTLFAKSDRPGVEPQVVTAFGPRPPGATLATQYLDIPDAGAGATLLSRPTWLWGAEHGLNEHRVAIGNEMIFTVDDPRPAPPALIGMDLVRLGLERGTTADEALAAMTSLLDRHGQGGVGDEIHGLSYWSAFLIADPVSAWVLETSGRRWAARPVRGGEALSNRLSGRRDWTRASADVAPGTDLDSWRHPGLPTGFADIRLAASRHFVDAARAPAGPGCDPGAVVAALRDHGTGPWGNPRTPPAPATTGAAAPPPAPATTGAAAPPPAPAPHDVSPDGPGWTLCLHAGDTAVTTASMVALLPADGDPRHPARAWMAPGSPCVSVYLPVPVPSPAVPVAPAAPALTDPAVWVRLAALRDAVGSDGGALGAVRGEMGALEDALWDEADGLGPDPATWEDFGRRATVSLTAALDRLAGAGLGRPAADGPAGPAGDGRSRKSRQ